MEIGHVVEFIDHEKILCAVILEIKKERLRILAENGREVKLAQGRLSHHSAKRIDPGASRVRVLETLRANASRRRALAAEIDVVQLWETLSEEQDWIDLETMTGLCFPGATDADHEAAVIRALFDHRLYFRYDRHRFFPVSRDEVERRLAREAEAARRRQIVETAARWIKAVQETDPPPPAPAIDAAVDLETMLLDYLLHGRDSAHAPLVKEMLVRSGVPEADGLLAVLIKSGRLTPNVNLDLLRYETPVAFAADETAAAQAALAGPPPDGSEDGRRDLTDLPLLTIDGQGTLDFDDALSLEPLEGGWRLGVHIADVAALVARDGILDAAARQRASSIYTPDLKIPMLPSALAENGCSLRAGHQRPAISLLVTLGERLEIVDQRIVASLIRVGEQLTYHDVNLMVEQRQDLAQLQRIATHFRQRRIEAGAVQINVPEVVASLDGSGQVVVHRLNRESPSRLIVSELMILANWLMAKALAQWGLPAIFRSQPAPRERLYQGEEGTLFQHHMQRKLLSRLVLDTQPQPHVGLGLDAYVTATSPIRKYFDLVTQRQLRAGLGIEAPYSPEEIARLLQMLEQPLARVALIQRRRQRYWLLKYLEGRVGAREEAICLQRRRSSYLILMPAYMLECDLPLSVGTTLNPKDLVQVTIQHVDARRDLLRVFLS
ncbi:MAG: RNB domain-containing ribonuclease [Deltaproteobacteria bacterium]|nr:RNB domain-containing ribonuclease [Deltaproteobacteria bacterium]